MGAANKTARFKLTIKDSSWSAKQHNTIFAREVIIKAQYLIVSKQSMILKLGLEYWRLKTVPLSRFIYNTLLESSLFEKKKQVWQERIITHVRFWQGSIPNRGDHQI